MSEEKVEPIAGEKAFEILVGVDRKYNTVSLRMDRLENGFEYFKHEIAKIDLFKEVGERQDKQLANLVEQNSALRKQIVDFNKAQQIINEQLKQGLLTFEAALHAIKNDHVFALEGIHEGISRLHQKQQDLKENAICLSDHQVHYSQLQALIDQNAKKMRDLVDGQNRFKQDLINLKDQVNELSRQVKALQDRVASDEKLIGSNDSKYSASMINLQNVIDIKIANVLKQVNLLNDQLKNELLASPVNLENAKKDLANRMESIALDASNSMLKANNIDQLFRLFERKFENLQLLVKKIEIDKG